MGCELTIYFSPTVAVAWLSMAVAAPAIDIAAIDAVVEALVVDDVII